MIKFFRKIRQKLLQQNKIGSYLKYAIGEIILVVIGILIALQINNWNTNSIRQADERKILIELQKGLELDRDKMVVELASCEIAVEKMKHLQTLLKDKNYGYHKGLDTLFGQVYGMRKMALNSAFYEDLKSSSLRIIDNEDIRLQIVQLFELNYKGLSDIFSGAEPSINEVIRPYYLSNFHDIKFIEAATPNNLDKVWNDTYFQNIVDFRIIAITSNQVMAYEKALPKINEIIRDIDVYLKLKK
jgi:hypothetical protein